MTLEAATAAEAPSHMVALAASGLAFWLLLAMTLGLFVTGSFAPKDFWLVRRERPKRQNFLFLLFAGGPAYLLVSSLQSGTICASRTCSPLFHRGVEGEAMIYWHLVASNLLLLIIAVGFFLAGGGKPRDNWLQRTEIEAAKDKRQALHAVIARCWQETSGGAGFVAALALQNLHCAADETGMYVVIDDSGAVHQLDYDVLNETKTAIRDTLNANLQGSGVTVPDIAAVRARLTAARMAR